MKRSYQILLHIAFWLIFNVLQYARYVALNYGDISQAFYLMVGVQILINLITFYGSYFLIFTRIFDYSKLRLFTLIGIYIVINIAFRVGVSRYIFSFVETESWLDKYTSIWLQTLFVFTYTGLSFLVRFTIFWFHDQQLKMELMNEKRAGELALLRAQVNPHFLFNTLNNLYSLALQSSDKVAVGLARLSEIMRYMLKESDTDKVSLDREINYLQSFIELQKLRFRDPGFVAVEISGDFSGKVIAPMLLIPFIENAFKHGNKDAPSPGIIIKLGIEQQTFLLQVTNDYKEKSDTPTNNGLNGIGLDNVKKRLELLYKNKYRLEINKKRDEKKFEVRLTIEL
ncbi:histidine kinase [Prolixibacter bellariivorans]|uniref:Histidine kinase n=1 Tax=Prolixibacter bellariivorans TaxID=314319 RepID=A0A5M4B533_9BACT|nr:sensor histidine kinase [Prolixibacter bellariivorans]GET34963.1 histidine kinase [Prolixibacter bellariivorans]